MGIMEWLMTGGLLTVAGFSIATYHKVGKELRTMEEMNGKKFASIYTKFDAERQKAEEHYVTKDVCKILHEHICKSLDDIKNDVKKLLYRGADGHADPR